MLDGFMEKFLFIKETRRRHGYKSNKAPSRVGAAQRNQLYRKGANSVLKCNFCAGE